MMSNLLSWPRAAVGLLVVFLTVNHRLVTGRAAPIYDAEWFFAPYQMLVADYARRGRLLLWNPWTNGGSPDFADPQVGAFSPGGVLVGAITGGDSAGFRFYWLLVWFAAGLGVLAIGKHMKAPPWAAFVAALGLLFSGLLLGNAEHVSWLYTFAGLPYVVWRLDVALVQGRTRPAFEAGAIWGLSGLAGYPGLLLATGAYAGLWAVGRWLCVELHEDRTPSGPGIAPIGASSHPTIGTTLRSLLIVFAIGMAVLSPTYAGFITEGRGFTDRTEPLPRSLAIGDNALHPRALATVFNPWIATLPPAKVWPYTDLSSSSIYGGAAVAWLGLCAVLMRPRDRWRWWVMGLGILGLALSLGQTLPFRGWLYDLVPPARYFRHAAMFRSYAIFSMTILAIMAARDLESSVRPRTAEFRGRLLLSAAIMFVVATACLYGVARVADNVPEPGHPVHFWVVWLGVLAAAAAGGLLRGRRRAVLFPGVLICLAVGDAFGAFRAAATTTVERRDLAGIEQWRRIDADHERSLDLTAAGGWRARHAAEAPGGKRANTNLPRKVAVLEGYTPFRNRFHLRWVRHPILSLAATGKERFWFASQAAWIVPSDATFDAFVSRTERLGAPPLVLHAPDALRGLPGAGEAAATDPLDVAAINTLPAASRISVQLEAYSPDELALRVDCPTDGWLLVTDRWAAGWRATVNGESAVIAGGDFIFRAVAVKEGLAEVRFTYDPFGFPWLLIVSWGSLAAVGCWTARTGWREWVNARRMSKVGSG